MFDSLLRISARVINKILIFTTTLQNLALTNYMYRLLQAITFYEQLVLGA